MPITVQHQVPAAAITSAAVVGGRGQYDRWLREFMEQQRARQAQEQLSLRQQNIGIRGQDLSRLNALTSVFAQAQEQQNRLGFGAFERAQDRAADFAKLDLTQQIRAQQDQREAARQQANIQQQYDLQQRNQLAAQGAMGQRQAEQTALTYRERDALNWRNRLANPFAEYNKAIQPLVKQGFDYAPEEKTRLQKIKADIGAITQAVGNGEMLAAHAMPQFKKLYGQLNAIQPSVQKPNTATTIGTAAASAQEINAARVAAGLPELPLNPSVAYQVNQRSGGMDIKPIEDPAAKMQEMAFKMQMQVQDKRVKWVEKQVKAVSDWNAMNPNMQMPIPNDGELMTRASALYPDFQPKGGNAPQPAPQPAMQPPQPAPPPQPMPQPDPRVQEAISRNPEIANGLQVMKAIVSQYGPDPSRWNETVRNQYAQWESRVRGAK